MSKHVLEFIKARAEHTVFNALGIVVDKVDADETIVSLKIDERHKQHVGLVHGGVYVLLAESAASIAAACTLTDPEHSVVAIEINANHIKSCDSGVLSAHSKNLHKGRQTLVYEVRVEDGANKLISIARCTLMVVKKVG